MFIERRSNGIWYYRKITIVNGTRKVLRKSLFTYNKAEAQFRAMNLHFNVDSLESPPVNIDTPIQPAQVVLDDGFIVNPSIEHTPYIEVPYEQPEVLTEVEQDAGTGIRGIIEAYLAENAHLWSTKEAQGQRAAINRFCESSNVTYIEQFTKQHAVIFKQSLISKGLSQTTINKFIGKLFNLFAYIHSHYEHQNIFAGLKIKRAKQETKRSAYSHKEVNKLIEFASNQEAHRKYMILLGLYTGARANELCQLYTSDIIKIDDVWVILIQATKHDQKLKTGNSQRVIPIHSALIKEGFIEFVQGRGHDCRLFPEFKYSATDGCSKAFVQWFMYTKPISKTFHELRHSFATQLKSKDVSLNVVAQILGHGTGAISFDRYGSTAKIQIELLQSAVELVSYENH